MNYKEEYREIFKNFVRLQTFKQKQLAIIKKF